MFQRVEVNFSWVIYFQGRQVNSQSFTCDVQLHQYAPSGKAPR